MSLRLREKICEVNDNHIVGDESRSGKQAILAPRKADDVCCFVALSAIYVGTAGQEALKQSPDELFVFFVFVFVFVSVFVHCSALYWPSHDTTKYQVDLYCMYLYFVLLSELNKIGLLTQCVCVAFLSQLDN